MNDEIEMLESLNPEPGVRGNPGPVRGASDLGIPRSRRVLALSAAAVVAVTMIGGAILLSRSDTTAPETVETASAPTATDTPETIEPSNGDSTTDPTLIELILPDPVIIEISPDADPEDSVVQLPGNGITVLEIQGSGWSDNEGEIIICQEMEITANGLECGGRFYSSGAIPSGNSFVQTLALPLRPGVYQLAFADSNEDRPIVASQFQVAKADMSIAPVSPNVDNHRVPWDHFLDRLDPSIDLTGNGWEPDRSVVFYRCSSPLWNANLNVDECGFVYEATTNSSGSFLTTFTLPAIADPHPPRTSFDLLIAFQGTTIATLRTMTEGVGINPALRLPSDDPLVIQVTNLRQGEIGEIRTCATINFPDSPCSSPRSIHDVVGSGSGIDEITVDANPDVVSLELWMNGELVNSIESNQPDQPPAAPSGDLAITVSPSSVPGPGTYTFTVIGTGFSPGPGLFMIPCIGNANPEDCDLSNLTPVGPDRPFEVQATYEVGAEGLIITVSDAAADQLASAPISIEANAPALDNDQLGLTPAVATEAEQFISEFIQQLRSNQIAGALSQWTGYPDAQEPDAGLFDQFINEFEWLVTDEIADIYALPSWAFVQPTPIVTVVSKNSEGFITHATSFVLSNPSSGGPLQIERLPDFDDGSFNPVLTLGDNTIAINMLPFEGGARAFVNRNEVPTEVDHDTVMTTIITPNSVSTDYVLTFISSTSEWPGVQTFIITPELSP